MGAQHSGNPAGRSGRDMTLRRSTERATGVII